jgi:hypothetical protein
MEQLMINLWPEKEPEKYDVVSDFMNWAKKCHGCDDTILPYVERLYDEFGKFGVFDRGKGLLNLAGTHKVDGYSLDDVDVLGVYDASLDYHTVWDRGWAAYAGVDKAMLPQIAYCKYNTKSPMFFDADGELVAVGSLG